LQSQQGALLLSRRLPSARLSISSSSYWQAIEDWFGHLKEFGLHRRVKLGICVPLDATTLREIEPLR
jgi:hypothetical protein